MKFKVDKKDWILFCIYCVILLYLCAIAVLNFSSLANNGEFYGLAPFKAFLLPYLPITIILFISVLVLIFISVSSYIFDKDKTSDDNFKGLHFAGKTLFGVKVSDKGSDGYSRWASDKEMKQYKNVEKVSPLTETVDYAGIPVMNNGKDVYVDNGESHSLVIGSTGCGKTECLVKPMVNLLARHGESMIITDPKGELYSYSADNLRKKGYKIIVLNFRDPQEGNAWNPLSLPYQYYKDGNIDKATELLDDVALNILYDKSEGSDSAFWQKTAADYFSGLAMGLFMDAKEDEININSINYMSTVGEERYGTGHYDKEYFTLKGEGSSAYVLASATINAPNDTKGGIMSTFKQKIRLFSSRENLSEMLSHSDFDMRDIGKGKTAVFMVIHDEKKTYHSLMTIFIKQCYETLIDVAQSNGGKLPQRTNFILDEFANMPPLKDVDSMISAARSRDIRFTFIIQNFAQLNEVYGEQVAQVIRGNCGNLIYLISTELKALEEISKMCGEVKSKEKDKTASTPLVTVSDLQKLKLFEAIIIKLRLNPFRTQLTPDFKMDWGYDRVIETKFPHREKQEVKLFDLKKFVSDEKRKQATENGMMDSPFGSNMGGFNPYGGAMPGSFNPFGGQMPMPSQNPFLNSSPSPLGNKPISDEDIDAMMKDIDRKLKELDEEEAKEKASSNVTDDNKDDVINSSEPSKNTNPFMQNPPKETISKKEEKPKVNVDNESEIVNENVITDDEFFDDFFGDE